MACSAPNRFSERYPDHYGGLELPPLVARRSAGCGARNVYVDLGANWCNSLRLFAHVPSAPPPTEPWQVYAFEAAPLIVPFVERCCADLTRGLPLPRAPVPPTGSSQQLLKHARSLNCTNKGRAQQFSCIGRALNASLHALQPSPELSANASLLRARLHGARRRGCSAAAAAAGAGAGGRAPPPAARRSHYRLIPAAASAHDGQLQMAGSPMQMMRGGSFGSNKAEPNGRAGHLFNASLVDVVRWLRTSFALDDFVVLKMDIEGAENEIVPALLATNTSRLVDVLLWECHLKLRGPPGKCQCAAWDRALKAAGVKAIYHDPYPFAKASDSPEFVPG